MNYQKLYDSIIENAKSRGLDKKKLDGYFEKHHIIPRCLDGKDINSNYVLLTAREHFLAHKLLWKTNKSHKGLFLAFHKMSLSKRKYQDRVSISARDFETLRVEFCKFNSGEHNPMFGKTTSDKQKTAVSILASNVKTDEHKLNIGKALTGRVFSEETISKLKLSRANQKYIRYAGLEIDNIFYSSVVEAAEALNVKIHVVKQRCKNHRLFPNWKRIKKEES